MACCAIYPRSKLDSAQTTRKAFSCAEEAHRVINSNSLIDKRNSRIALTYRVSPNCCCVCTMIFYNDVVEEINTVTTTACVASGLCGDYFTLYSAKDGTQYRVWYDVDCMGTAPTSPCITLIEVDIVCGDLAPVVALATQQAVDLNSDFCASVLSNIITVTNSSIGLSTATADGCGLCAFSFCNTNSGKNGLQYTLCFVYDACERLITVDRL